MKLEEGSSVKLNIYMHVGENSGVGYYRQYLPAVKLREHDLANVLISDFRWGEGNHVEPDIKQLYQLMLWADLVVVGRRDVGEFYSQWGGIKEYFNLPIILDTDDNVRFVRPDNPGYQGYYPGAESIVWNKFATMKIFDAVTVSTQELKEFLSKENPRIYILPNNLDFKEWDSHENKVYNDGFIRIGFVGSAAHTEGVSLIKEPVRRILEKHKNVKFLITHVYRHLFNDYPENIKERIEYIPWIKLEEWPKQLKQLGLDIGLAPLVDNMFNRAKSNLRWMEYSASKIAPIVSPVKAYSCVKDNETGLIAKERNDWFTAMDKLISGDIFRGKMASTAHEEVKTRYGLDLNIGLWYNAYREVHDKFHEFFGPKKRFVKISKNKYKEILSR